jgi:NitT/TauT family transport system substrate-binding protein
MGRGPIVSPATAKFCIAFVAATLLSCSHGGSAPAPHKVRVALTVDGITWHPVRLAQSLGYASEEGIRISESDFAGLSKGMEALLGGSVDITAGGLPQALQVAAEGRSVRCFLALNSRPAVAFAVAPSAREKIHTVRDLKGRRVGISSPGSVTHQFLNFFLVSNGLLPTDVGLVSVGTGAASIAALEHGTVDAAILVASGITTFEQRYPKATLLADVRTEEGARRIFGVSSIPLGGLNAKDEWLRSNPDTARHFARAVEKAMQWMAHHTPEEIRATIPEAMRMPDIDADLAAIRYSQNSLTLDGIIPPEAPQIIQKFLAVSDERVRNSHLDLSSVYTNEFASMK